MTRRSVALIGLTVCLFLAACAGRGAGDTPASEAADFVIATPTPSVASASEAAASALATPIPSVASAASDAGGATTPATTAPTALPAASADSDADAVDVTPTPPLAATRVGSDYVLLLPREDAVPAGWAISPPPDFQTRAPGPDDTYRFACRDLPARSIGIATVGYRHLDGLPSVAIEYVIYASADAAAAALADMRAATETCGDFAIGQGEAATAAALAPLAFDPLGDDSFAAALTTGGDTTGGLLTHVVKVRQGHVVIGVSHTVYADQAPPDAALTRALAERAVENLRHGPQPTGPSA